MHHSTSPSRRYSMIGGEGTFKRLEGVEAMQKKKIKGLTSLYRGIIAAKKKKEGELPND